MQNKTIQENINQETKDLYEAILLLSSTEEATNFFRDLLTKQEIIEFSKRWQAARLLHKKMPYTKISEITNLSSTTIARISLWLNHGKDGYKSILDKIERNDNGNKS